MASIADLEADPIASALVRTISELVVARNSRAISVPVEGLVLRSLVRGIKADMIQEKITTLKSDGWLDELAIDSGNCLCKLSDKVALPSTQDDMREVVDENAVKRALLYKLYERYREVNHHMAALVQLGDLADALQTEKRSLQRIVWWLEKHGFLEYRTADGGQCICNITPYGVDIAKTASSLLSHFPTLGIEKKPQVAPEAASTPAGNPQRVFVVHGRNEEAKSSMFQFLRSIDLDPIEWGEALRLAGEGSPYNGEIVERALGGAQAVVVLFTGDDLARMDDRLLHKNEPPETTQMQPRPNVLFEAGMAFGRMRSRTIIVEMGAIRPISDIAGRNTVRLDNTPAKRQDLVDRLRDAGCPVRIEGRTDWQTVGDFVGCVDPDGVVPPALGSSSIPSVAPLPSDPASRDAYLAITELLKNGPRTATVSWEDDRYPGMKECTIGSLDISSAWLKDSGNDREFAVPLRDVTVTHDTKRNRPHLMLAKFVEKYRL